MSLDPRMIQEMRRSELGIETPTIDPDLLVPAGLDTARQMAVARGRDRVDPHAIPMDPRSLASRAPRPEKDESTVPSPAENDVVAQLQAAGVWVGNDDGDTSQAVPLRIHEKRNPSQRVTFYAAREEGIYVVAVEEAPDWDTVDQWRLSGLVVASVIPLLQSLGVKLKDCSAELGHFIREARHEEHTAESSRTPVPDTTSDESVGWEKGDEGGTPQARQSRNRRDSRRKSAPGR